MDFPKEMIEELLIRLPLKTITKFKCVSKDWKNIISCNEFRMRYQFLKRKDTRPCGLFYHHKNSHFIPKQTLCNPCMPVHGQAKFINTSTIEKEDLGLCEAMQQIGFIVGSSEGLILLSRNPMSYHVFDPLTKTSVQLPKILKKYKFVCTGFICKEREQNCSNSMTGSSSYMTYKVIRVGIPTPMVDSTKYKVETYSSETGKWHRSVMTCALEFCLTPHWTAKVIGGVLHWKNRWGNTVTAYDPEDSMGHVTLIEYPLSNRSTLTGTQGGRLLCIDEFFSGIDVWVLGSKYEGRSYLDEDIIKSDQWTLSHKIDFETLGLSYVDFGPNADCYFGHAIDIHPKNPNVIFIESNIEVLSYNLDEEIIEIRSSKRENRFPLSSHMRTNFTMLSGHHGLAFNSLLMLVNGVFNYFSYSYLF